MEQWMDWMAPRGIRGIPGELVIAKYKLTAEGLVRISSNEQEVFDEERMERLKAAAKKRLDDIQL